MQFLIFNVFLDISDAETLENSGNQCSAMFSQIYFMTYFYAPISTNYHCVWSVRPITAHNLTPEKRDNNYSSHSHNTPQTVL